MGTPGEMSKLHSNELVGRAFKAAGYTCKGYHTARNYAGTPSPTAACRPGRASYRILTTDMEWSIIC